MLQRTRRFVPLVGVLWLALAWMVVRAPAQSSASGTSNGEWPAYAGDLRNFHYSPLDQINAGNFSKLEVAWRFKTDSLGTRPEFKLEGTPLMVKGVVYATAGTRRSVVALDAATGELLWVHGEHEGTRSAVAPRQLSGRGLAYWTDGREERILYITIGFRLVELDAKTGAPIQPFGRNGIIDLKEVAVYGNRQPIDPVTGEIGVHSTPAVTRDGVVLVGSSFREGGTPKTHNNTKGLVQAFDVRTGKRLWIFNTIPRPGEFGSDTWLNDSWAINGNVGVWNQIAVDEDLGIAYLPVETPTSDFYGGLRPGDNLFAESIVAVDLKTGQRKWHFQLVHHPIWNMDIAAAPILADINVGGRPVKAVAVMGKQAMMYVFDRVTGRPVWPIEERPVPQSDVPGEKTSPTQPFPTRPPPYDYQGVTADNLIDFTPELRAEAMRNVSKYKLGPIFTPAVVSKVEGPIAAFRSSGGTNWPGGSYDPETHIAYVPSFVSFPTIGLLPPPSREFSDIDYVEGLATTGVRYVAGPGENAGADAPVPPAAGRGSAGRSGSPAQAAAGAVNGRSGQAAPTTAAGEGGGGGGLNPQGLPLLKPPYGRITAINLDQGNFVWQIPHGETPDAVRNHPALKGLTIPRTGQSGAVGALVTKTLVIAGEPLATTTPDHPRGAMLRAYDKMTGREAGAVYMPAQQSGSPMTYRVNGKQYIVVAISGGLYSGEYLALKLP
jgi:quinoprotein glucose dehydrogenase